MGLHCLLGLFYFPSIQLIQGVSNILCFISCLRIFPSFLASIVLSLFVRKWPPNSCRLYKCTYLLQAFIKGKGGRDELEKHIFSWTPCAKRSRSVTGASGIKNFENACLRFKFFLKRCEASDQLYYYMAQHISSKGYHQSRLFQSTLIQGKYLILKQLRMLCTYHGSAHCAFQKP